MGKSINNVQQSKKKIKRPSKYFSEFKNKSFHNISLNDSI